ncbi:MULTISPECIES: bifunctional helix-turn-helix transcriptional regulator/GNAT family N-acetyltransferase [Cupriavidus]|jgi:DNA-binding MarR family transcriptional regulator/N-acetylglutamate synthase-like GNAT family acetyltransferase|uniref:Bifunctional helix-turn-helix transcriptional regulator/GNAT family N-acetyltransferase n=1 Tax=Cupriavidus pauculus TaxID=82633 RepID=A0A5P2H8U2_9BURK|nr:bifunctional helix-turn-helix transcriptional regulator/GNAT family N-acetyltransferase [Cupriavidus pauculus]QET04597.1 bifunctional helix-turn-helix transcriptional regulator/GNAT family N-acetyltransferase [Cupriavidus pauculus]
MNPDPALVEDIRNVSREMVRELGFMGGDFAGTDLSPSAVHALIEIEKGGVTARDLGALLRLEKSSVSRMLRRLVEAGDVAEESDGRVKRLSLTRAGRHRVGAIHAYARSQVVAALKLLKPGDERVALQGMRLYARALGGGEPDGGSPVHLVRGYRPGLIARITEMHALYYARESGFGQHFESVVASGLAEFCNRLENPRNAIWTARQDGEIVGSIAIDGEDMGKDVAHLRWFIIDDGVRGGGVGKKLIDAAVAFVDERGFLETHLWTFAGLRAARHLYETRGFVLTEEKPGAQWGKEVLEQRFVRPRP